MHDSELIEKDPGDDGDDEEGQLGHDERELGHAQDLGADHAADPHGGDPGMKEKRARYYNGFQIVSCMMEALSGDRVMSISFN